MGGGGGGGGGFSFQEGLISEFYGISTGWLKKSWRVFVLLLCEKSFAVQVNNFKTGRRIFLVLKRGFFVRGT